MKLQIMSDAHMQVDYGFGWEYGRLDFPVVAPNLVLLGGMGRICDIELQNFIILQLTRFERVFYVMGIDEFHQSTIAVGRQQMKAFAENLIKTPPTTLPSGESINKLGVFHYLHRTRVDVEDVTILGCTLWRGWKENSSQARERISGGYRPIKDFFAEEETVERDLDIAWLQSQIEACANGEAAASVSLQGEAMAAPPDQPSTDPAATFVDEGDIYDDVEMSPPTKLAELIGDQPSENVSLVNQPLHHGAPEPSMPSSPKRQGPARRVIILTAHPPTFKGTAVPGHGPAREEQTKEATVVLRGQQCWGLDSRYRNGVVVDSRLHGRDDPRPQKGNSSQVGTSQPNTEASETPSCGHDNGSTGDPYRPPGVVLWAFGYTEWSCDIEYQAPVAMTLANDPKGKKPETAEPSVNNSNRCPQCNRVLVPIRLVSNQCGQQWKRNPVPYVDAPPNWRAFDEAFVVDV